MDEGSCSRLLKENRGREAPPTIEVTDISTANNKENRGWEAAPAIMTIFLLTGKVNGARLISQAGGPDSGATKVAPTI